MTQESDALDARVRRLEDLDEIRQLVIDYKVALDGKDNAAYAALFAADGTLWCTPELQATGRGAIKELVDGMSGGLLAVQVGTDFHAVANHRIVLDGDIAHGEATWLYFVIGDDGAPQLSKVGHYTDDYVREDGRWRFQRREAVTDVPVA